MEEKKVKCEKCTCIEQTEELLMALHSHRFLAKQTAVWVHPNKAGNSNLSHQIFSD